MALPHALSRFKKWPWSRTLVLVGLLLGLLIFNLIPDREDRAREHAPDAATFGDANAGSPANAGQVPRSSSLPPAPNPGETRHGQTRSPEDLPIWERPPRTTAQPFPEEARFDPPLPPFKVPPEMIGPPSPPPATVDADATRPVRDDPLHVDASAAAP